MITSNPLDSRRLLSGNLKLLTVLRYENIKYWIPAFAGMTKSILKERKIRIKIIIFLLILVFCGILSLQNGFSEAPEARFPRPDFESEYQTPETKYPPARAEILEYLDVLILIMALALSSYLALKKRSRTWIFALTLFSLAYFGFYREGCICAIGAIQNFTLALFDSGYVIPLTALAFFLIPMIFTLFFGRTFCSSVCPLGAIQEVVIFKPIKLPVWLAHTLSMLAYIYLGLAVLFAATGTGFLICQYDPFISFFRMSGTISLLLLGVSFLLLGIFIARPYCRFLCPYGVLLSWMSRFSRSHTTITPDECVKCRLCEDSCPIDAINKPDTAQPYKSRSSGVIRLAILLISLPLFILIGGWSMSKLSIPLSKANRTVSLALEIEKEEAAPYIKKTDATKAFRETGIPIKNLYKEKEVIEKRFIRGGWILGIFLGLAFCLKIIGFSIKRSRKDYEPDKGRCISCGRCFEYCPEYYQNKNDR